MILLEILLTISAWRNGWGARALLPCGAVFLIGFIIGAVAAADGAALEVSPGWILLDLLAIILLAVMTFRRPLAATAAPDTESANISKKTAAA